MRKRRIAYLMSIVMFAATVFPSGITVYAEEDAVVAASAGQPEGNVRETVDMPQPDKVATGETTSDDTMPDRIVLDETAPDEIVSDETVSNEIAPADITPNETTSDEVVPDTSTEADMQNAPALTDDEVIVSAVEVVGEADISPIAAESDSEIESVTLHPKDCYNTFTLRKQIMSLNATVKYASGEETTVNEWTWESDNNYRQVISHVMNDGSGDVITVSFWENEWQMDLPVPGNRKMFTGSLTLKAVVNGEDVGSEAMTRIVVPEAEDLPGKTVLSYGETQCFAIPVQPEDCVLRVSMGESLYGGFVDAGLYLINDEEPNMEDSAYLSGSATKTFEIKAGNAYLLVLDGTTSSGTELSFEFGEKKTVQSITLPGDMSFENTFEALESLQKMPATVQFTDGTEETITEWSTSAYWDDEEDDEDEYNCLSFETRGKNVIKLVIRRADSGKLAEMYGGYRFPVGTFVMKAYVDDSEVPITNGIIKVEFNAPKANQLSSERDETAYSLTGSETQYFYIPGQDTAKFLHIFYAQNSYVKASLYFAEEQTGDLYSCGNPQAETGEKKGAFYRLGEGMEYWIALSSSGNAPCEGTIKFEDQKAVTSISIQNIKASCDMTEVETILENAEVYVTYEGEEPERLSYLDEYSKESEEFYYGLSRYGDRVLVRPKRKGGDVLSYIDQYGLDLSLPLLPGEYTLLSSIESAPEKKWETPFTVTYSEPSITSLGLNTDYPVALAEGKVKLFHFTPTQSGRYSFSSATPENAGRNSAAMLYDSDSNRLNYSLPGQGDGYFSLTDDLHQGQTYYYVVYGDGLAETSTTVRLVKNPDIKAVVMETEPTDTTFVLHWQEEMYYRSLGMKVRIFYTDGSSEVVTDGNTDRYGNYVYARLYPLDGFGNPDMNCYYYFDDIYEPGSFALFATAEYWGEKGHVMVNSPTWVKAVFARHGHVHSWESDRKTDRNPDCTTAGRMSIHCSDCGGSKSGTAVAIPATGHRWGSWSVNTAGKAVRTRICKTCHKSESQDFTPVLALTADKLTMKSKQSTMKFKVTAMAEGDALASVTSNKTKLLRVSNVDPNGTFKLKAQKKTGTAKLTITLRSGVSRTIKVKIQGTKVKTVKIKVASRKLTLSRGQKYELTPVITPVTSYDKLKCTSSNRKVATVSRKGRVTAKGKGKATITIASGKKKVKVSVIVK